MSTCGVSVPAHVMPGPRPFRVTNERCGEPASVPASVGVDADGPYATPALCSTHAASLGRLLAVSA